MFKKLYLALVIAVFFTASISGCSSVPRITYDTIKKIYADEKPKPKDHPVIFIPGIFGTVLQDGDNGKVIWGKVSQGLIEELALPIDRVTMSENKDQVVPVKPVGKFSWVCGLVEKNVYNQARYVAVDVAGYTMDKNVFSLSYDWRRDLVEGAKHLGELIDEIKHKMGKPDQKVDIVCHSAGGLIARYYAKYGTEDVLDRDPIPPPTYAGAKNINKIIMLGTPSYGTIESFKDIDNGLVIPCVGVVTKNAVFSMPSAYELMPFDGRQVFINAKGEDLDVDLYDPSNWEKYGWSVFASGNNDPDPKELDKERRFLAAALKRASAFQKALWNGDHSEEGKRVTYILLGSDSEPTLRRVLLRQTQSGWRTQFDPHDDTLAPKSFGFGDGTVTRRSLLGTHVDRDIEVELPSAYEIFFAQSHIDLTEDPTFLDNVLHSLLDKENDWQKVD